MRDIKFRGIDNNNRWRFGFLVYSPFDTAFNIIEVGEIPPTYSDPCGDVFSEGAVVNPDTVGQFTGLKDKNGKEIYEGDIVCGDIFDEKFKMAEVVFDVGCFSVSVKEDWCPALYDVTADTTVIIGNIHEDPELLEAK